MTKLPDLLQQIKQQIEQNNTGLTSEDTKLANLSQRCDNIHHLLNSIDNSLDNFQKTLGGIEIAPEEIQRALRELNLTEVTCENLKTKLAEILQLASDGNQQLADKIKEVESELEGILTSLQQQQTVITNYQAQITRLETKITSNENHAQQLQIKAGLIGSAITGAIGSLLVLLARFVRRFKRRN